jgi:hypothetical protein
MNGHETRLVAMRPILILGPDGILRRVDKGEREDGFTPNGDAVSINNAKKRKRVWRSSTTYGFVRARQLDGTILEGPRVGTHIITSCRVRAGWGIVSERRWPRLRRGDMWPTIEPPGLDDIFNRRRGHFRARNLTEIRACVAQGVPIQVSLPIHNGWRSPAGGVIKLPGVELVTENHSIVLEGFDDNRELIKFWNNWGPSWGDGGYGYLPYHYADRHIYDSWVFDPLVANLPQDDRASTAFPAISRRVAVRNILGHVWAQIDLWDVVRNVRMGWCFAVVRDSRFEIEDFFLRPDEKRPGNFDRLVTEIRRSSEFFQSPVTFWIPQIDTESKSANFDTVNNLIRTLELKVRRSGVRWAAYRADQP